MRQDDLNTGGVRFVIILENAGWIGDEP